MPASIFNPSGAVRILKDILKFKTNTEIITTTIDPIVTGFPAQVGSMLLKTDESKIFKKINTGNTNWTEFVDLNKITVMYPIAGVTRTFATLQAAFNSIPAATNTTDVRQIYTVFVPSGTYDEELSIELNNRRIIVYCRGTVNIGALSGSSWGAGGTVRNVTLTNNGTAAIGSIRSAIVFTNEAPLIEGVTSNEAYLSKFRISGNLILTSAIGISSEFHLEMEVFGNVDCSGYAGNCNIYTQNSRFRGLFGAGTPGAGIARLQNARRVNFVGAVNVAIFSNIQDCKIDAGLTTTIASPEVLPAGMFNVNFSGTFTGPATSARMDNVTNYWFTTNGATLAGGATKVLLENYSSVTDDGILSASNFSLFNSTSNMSQTGVISWSGTGNYYSINGFLGEITVLRGGTGRINNVLVTWAGGQKVAIGAGGSTYFVYVDQDGILQITTSVSTANLYIKLFEVLYDGTNFVTVREDHPFNFATKVSDYLHNNVGAVIQATPGSGSSQILANITRVATGTGAAVGDRQLKIVGAAVLSDHGLSTTIPDSAGAAITINWYYTNASGKWIRYVQQSQAPMVYNNAGTITALTTGPNSDTGIFTIYASKDDLNTSTPTYFGVINNDVYNTIALAQTAINSGLNQLATNELYALELAQLGTIIVENNGTSGYINTVNISKDTLRSGTTTGGGTGSAATVNTVTTNFDSWLSAADTTVQNALETLDDTGKDSIFRISNTSDLTKKIALSASGITTGTTRTITMPDRDLNLDTITSSTTSTNITGFLRGNGSNVASQVISNYPQYCSNNRFEVDTTGYFTFQDPASPTPQNGTGGTPNITFARNTTNPLRSPADGMITKDAVNRQGEGVSYGTFTFDQADLGGKKCTISFDYSASANFVFGAASDIQMYLYSTTNASFVPLVSNVLSGNGKFYGEFFNGSPPNGNYRVIFYIATTNALAWTFNFTNLQISPVTYDNNRSYFRFDRNGNDQTGVNPNSSYVKILYNSISSPRFRDSDSQVDFLNSRVIITQPGMWHFDARIQIKGANILADYYALWMYINGSNSNSGDSIVGTVGKDHSLTIATTIWLDYGDIVEVYLYGSGDNSVNTLTLEGTYNRMFFTGFKI